MTQLTTIPIITAQPTKCVFVLKLKIFISSYGAPGTAVIDGGPPMAARYIGTQPKLIGTFISCSPLLAAPEVDARCKAVLAKSSASPLLLAILFMISDWLVSVTASAALLPVSRKIRFVAFVGHARRFDRHLQ